ncbi:MAG: hypothetical protein ACOVOV_02585 [Dolichospermum sp.]
MKAELEIKGNSAEDAFEKMQKAMEEIQAVLMPGSKYLIHGKDIELSLNVICHIIRYYRWDNIAWITSVIDQEKDLCKFILNLINQEYEIIVIDDIQSIDYLINLIFQLNEILEKLPKESILSIVFSIDFELSKNQIDATFESFTIINSSHFICS